MNIFMISRVVKNLTFVIKISLAITIPMFARVLRVNTSVLFIGPVKPGLGVQSV